MPEENLIQTYVENLIKQAGFDKLPEDFVQDQKNNLQVEVQRRLGLEVVQHLEAKDLEDFSVLAKKEGTGEAELLKFFQEHVKDFDVVVQGVLEKFSKEFLSDLKIK